MAAIARPAALAIALPAALVIAPGLLVSVLRAIVRAFPDTVVRQMVLVSRQIVQRILSPAIVRTGQTRLLAHGPTEELQPIGQQRQVNALVEEFQPIGQQRQVNAPVEPRLSVPLRRRASGPVRTRPAAIDNRRLRRRVPMLSQDRREAAHRVYAGTKALGPAEIGEARVVDND